MENEDIWKIAPILLVGVILGGLLTYGLFPQTITETETITKEIEVPVEVIKEVPTETTVEVEVEKDFNDYKDEAIDKCIAELKEDLDLDEYQKVTIREVSDDWDIDFFTVNNFHTDFKDEDRTTVTIDEVKLRYIDTLTENRINKDMWCEVIYRGERGEIVNYNTY